MPKRKGRPSSGSDETHHLDGAEWFLAKEWTQFLERKGHEHETWLGLPTRLQCKGCRWKPAASGGCGVPAETPGNARQRAQSFEQTNSRSLRGQRANRQDVLAGAECLHWKASVFWGSCSALQSMGKRKKRGQSSATKQKRLARGLRRLERWKHGGYLAVQ